MMEKLQIIEIICSTGVRLVGLRQNYDSTEAVKTVVDRIESVICV